ncbi:hypothetical protein KAFR_0B07010 [Kazachstania africana CBS 2517]|uniref:Thioesterase domain-containing protein n=1 Tax=Kazachstania africana (strain ATCC 22294 / BCRC 22015 / CBS 2517 / CECT 1963 / NBRC 1671 / NRRL Y-8276) TaxID=1071382 RepID=H2ARJ9_KAZAF|nr:hypothetical protein KAFR_0B07010 [Kazachstania africana CBS 2517]CCF56999.1 hypothetical protein KAFR_0B07010 [Kazachstania africana CBS 2517]
MYKTNLIMLGKRGLHYSTAQFKTKIKPKRWIPYSIFGVSFFTGWIFTQQMTFTDLMAYWRYDKLPQDAEEVRNYQGNLLQRAERLPVVRQLKSSGYIEVFPKRRTDDKLIDQTLSTPGGIAISPKIYYNPASKETVGIYHLGMKLTGYPFIVHGGILATVMEDLMRESVKIIKNKEGEKTKDLKVSYKLPTLANQFVVIRTTKIENIGKNIKLSVDVMDETGNRNLVKGQGIFSA